MHRAAPQKEYRAKLQSVSNLAHLPFDEIIGGLPDDAILPVLEYLGIWEMIDVESISDPVLKDAILERIKAGQPALL